MHTTKYTYVDLYISGLIISLWEPDNLLFVRGKYGGYAQKAEANKKVPFDTTARS